MILTDRIKSRIPDSLRKAIREFRDDLSLWRLSSGRVRHVDAGELDVALPGEFLVTSEVGVYRVSGSEITKVLDIPTYGIAISGPELYLSCSTSTRSMVLAGNSAALFHDDSSFSFRSIYSVPISDSGQRIHQIALDGDQLWVANTPRNTLVCIGRESEEVISEVAPFTDRFGEPILGNHNHINSIFPLGESVVFVAYRTGDVSCIGIVKEGSVTCFPYRHRGVHDVYVRRRELVFCDTFGRNRPDEGGALIVNGIVWYPDFFNPAPGFVLRGIAEIGDHMVLGHSHKGERRIRFQGNGSLLVGDGDDIQTAGTMPCSQVYDILRSDGRSFDPDPEGSVSHDEFCAMAEASLGPPHYVGRVRDLAAE